MLLKILNIVLFLTWFAWLWYDETKKNCKFSDLIYVIAILLAGFICYAWNLT